MSALLTPPHLFPWYSPSPGDYRQEQWVGNSSRLSLMPPCSPSDSLLMHSLFLSVSLLHQLSRVPALLRGHPSKVLTRALQQLIAASWCLICRVAKGMVITLTSICERCFFLSLLFFLRQNLRLPEPLLLPKEGCQKWDSNPLVQERLCLGQFGHPDTLRSPPALLVHSSVRARKLQI